MELTVSISVAGSFFSEFGTLLSRTFVVINFIVLIKFVFEIFPLNFQGSLL